MHGYYAASGMWDGNIFGPFMAYFGPLFFIVLVWTLLWQGLGLWHSARRGEWIWFVVFLVVHTLGILEIIYLFAFAKLKMNELFSKKEPHRS